MTLNGDIMPSFLPSLSFFPPAESIHLRKQIVISKSAPTFVAAKYQTELDSKIAIIPPKITDGNWLRLHKVFEMAVKVACGVAKRPTYVSYGFLQGPCE